MSEQSQIDPYVTELFNMDFEKLIAVYQDIVKKIDAMVDMSKSFVNGKADKPLMINFFKALKIKMVIKERLPKIQDALNIASNIQLNNLNSWY